MELYIKNLSLLNFSIHPVFGSSAYVLSLETRIRKVRLCVIDVIIVEGGDGIDYITVAIT